MRGVGVRAAISSDLSQTLDFSRWLAATLVLIYHLRLNILVDPNTSPETYGHLEKYSLEAGRSAIEVAAVSD
jgi:peptidoglycan/LPS O-acetylase OafA/YrhL